MAELSEKYVAGLGYAYSIDVDDIEAVEEALGNLKKKAPAVMKVTINATGRYARKLMVSGAKKRYVLTARGKQEIEKLKMVGKATNTNLSAKLHISSYRNDLSYFDVYPRKFFIGGNVANAPEFFRGRQLRSESRKNLSGDSKHSKAFMVPFESGHIGVAQRQLGVPVDHGNETTKRSKVPRWRSRNGIIEKLATYQATSATSAHNVIWGESNAEIGSYYYERLEQQIQKVIERDAQRKKAAK